MPTRTSTGSQFSLTGHLQGSRISGKNLGAKLFCAWSEREKDASPSALATSMSPLPCFLLLVPPPKLEWSPRKGEGRSCVPHSTPPPSSPSILGNPKEKQIKNQGEKEPSGAGREAWQPLWVGLAELGWEGSGGKKGTDGQTDDTHHG